MRFFWILSSTLIFISMASLAQARPWCSSSNLNLAERTICYSPELRALDVELAQAYTYAKARNQHHGQSYWLRSERDACGSNISCLSWQYKSRISVLYWKFGTKDITNPRPWCGSSNLNYTEQTICNTSSLRDYDGQLQYVYDQAKTWDLHSGQGDWLRSERDACGGNVSCITARYQERIYVLYNRMGSH